jgi:hypothetical protein
VKCACERRRSRSVVLDAGVGRHFAYQHVMGHSGRS